MEIKEKRKAPKKFTKEEEIDIFKELTHKSISKVADDAGLYDIYPNKRAANAAVYNIATKIKKNPDAYNMDVDTVSLVIDSMSSRSLAPKLIKSELTLQSEVFRDKLDDIRDMAADILQRKLAKIKKDKNGDASFRDLKELLSMAIDKGRLLKGESTEQVLHMSKIDVDGMSSKDALAMVLKAREALMENR